MSNSMMDVQPDEPWKDKAAGKEIKTHNKRTLIGSPPNNHWIHDANPPSFDLTRPAGPEYRKADPSSVLTIETTTTPIILSPSTTALVIIDMQNFFLSSAIGRDANGPGNKARQRLLDVAIPAADAAGIQVIWLNWGLTQEDLDQMPASTLRTFGFRSESFRKDDKDDNLDETDRPRKLYHGLGSDMGPVKLEDGNTVDGGRLLTRDVWNSALTPDLDEAYQKGLKANPPHVWIHKNRISGMWGASTPCTEFLEKQKLRSLIFAGVNTDQCVYGTLQDAYMNGYDCILLSDGTGTTSPSFAQQCVEYNTSRGYGFVTDCAALKASIDNMVEHKK